MRKRERIVDGNMRDNEIIYGDSYYEIDGKVKLAEVTGRVTDLKNHHNANSIRWIDQVAYGLKPKIRRF